jgi:membrane-bound ClpP family serine protease
MFIFQIKDNRMALDIAILRSLLALAAIASIFYRTNNPFYINISVAVVLFLLSVFARMILMKYQLRSIILAVIAAALFFIATHSIGFALGLLIIGMLPGFFYKAPMVQIGSDKVMVKRMIGSSEYQWKQLSNIILKDNLLTIDFKNNKVLQLEVDQTSGVDEKIFNAFCSDKIMQ